MRRNHEAMRSSPCRHRLEQEKYNLVVLKQADIHTISRTKSKNYDSQQKNCFEETRNYPTSSKHFVLQQRPLSRQEACRQCRALSQQGDLQITMQSRAARIDEFLSFTLRPIDSASCRTLKLQLLRLVVDTLYDKLYNNVQQMYNKSKQCSLRNKPKLRDFDCGGCDAQLVVQSVQQIPN